MKRVTFLRLQCIDTVKSLRDSLWFLVFDDNFGKCGSISTILLLLHTVINCIKAEANAAISPHSCSHTTL